jgi:hypothetical protein
MRPVSALALALLALSACKNDDDNKIDTGDTGDTTPAGTADLEVGGVADMVTEGGEVWADVVQPGEYIVVLTSADEAQGTEHGYGTAAAEARVVTPADPRPIPAGSHPIMRTEVGDSFTFEVYNGSRYVDIEAEAIQVTDELVVWEDRTTENEYGSVDEDMMADVIAQLEQIVLPRERVLFGEESDVDADGKLWVLMSYTVNMYGAQAYVTWCDIGVTEGCYGYGHGHEIVYLGYNDPDDSRASADGITETVAHELAHLIYAYHKVLLNGAAGVDENIYVTEGTSAMAQDLTGYNNGNQYVWAAALDMTETYGSDDYSVQAVSLNDLFRGSGYYDQARDGALRGGAYLFLRYLFEQAGGMTIEGDGSLTDLGGMAWIASFFAVPETGVESVEATMGADFQDLALDFWTALVVSGRDINDESAYNFHERVEDPLTGYEHGVDPFANIHGWLQLTGPLVQPLDEADGSLRAGGVEYLQATLEAGRLSVPVSEAALARARVFRIE